MVPASKLLARTMHQSGNFRVLRRNTGIYTNRGGTIGWLINPSGTAVIDAQFPDTAGDCVNGIRERREGRIDLLVNTHHHGDHTGGNGVFRPVTDKIVSHSEVPRLMKLQAQMRGSEDGLEYPDTVFETEWSADIGDETLRLHYFGPAHTSGDLVATFENANIVHMGDLVFNRVFPFIDSASGANVLNWIILLEKVVEMHDSETIYIFGHGEPNHGVVGNASDMLHMRNYLSALVEHVEKRSSAGDSREEIVSLVALPGFEDHISFGPRLSLKTNLEVVCNELLDGQ